MKTLSCEDFDAFESVIDTDYFGLKSAKVVLKKACMFEQTQRELLGFLQDFEFVVITNRDNNPNNNQWLGKRTTAFLTDVNIQFHKNVVTTTKNSNSTRITDNFPGSLQILQIAKNAFTISRFLNDPYLPAEKAKHIYADMTRNAFGKEGRFFVTFQEKEITAGFLLFSFNRGKSSIIELIAIDPNFAGKGIGRALLNAMEYYVAKEAVKTMKVGTQLNNTSAFNFYTSSGFNYFECSSIYHYWPLRN